MRNFAYPVFARTIPEFWQRWHISLMTWFRDYVYVPLAGNRKNPVYLALIIVLTFTLSGLWHGANWTFVLWGLLNGIYFVFSMVYRRFKRRTFPRMAPVPGLRNFWGMVLTFHLIFTTLFLFRAQDLAQAMDVASTIWRNFRLGFFLRDALTQKALIGVMLVVEWLQRAKAHPLEIGRFPLPVRWVVYNGMAASILLLGNFTYNPFIYFQF